MDLNVMDQLVLSEIYARAAWASGTVRGAIADGYSAVDIAFSALLLSRDISPSHNHKGKLDQVVSASPGIFQNASTTQGDVEDFYKKWLAVRYDNASTVTSKEAVDYLRLSSNLISAIVAAIACRYGEDPIDVESRIYENIFATSFSKIDETVSEIHDGIQLRLEMLGEAEGSKLGNKMVNTSNFCQILALAGDPMTKKIVGESDELALRIGTFYSEFVTLIDWLQMSRLSEGLQAEEMMNFTFSLRLGYYGRSFQEIRDQWKPMFEQMLASRNDEAPQ